MMKKSAVYLVVKKTRLLLTIKPNRLTLPKYYTTSDNNTTELKENVTNPTTLTSDIKNENSINLVKQLKDDKSTVSNNNRQLKTVSKRRKSIKINTILSKNIFSTKFKKLPVSDLRLQKLFPILSSAQWVKHEHTKSSNEKRRLKQNNVTFEEELFKFFKNDENEKDLSIRKFFEVLKEFGIRKDDPRIYNLIENLKEIQRNSDTQDNYDTQKLSKESFQKAIKSNLSLLEKTFNQKLVIPDFQSFIKDIDEIYKICKHNKEGQIANYIPQLARVNPDFFGVSICTIDGQRYSIGDVQIPFTMQSCSKALTYAIALEHLGSDIVHSYVGLEPSGRMFNELILDYNKRPHNPMINAGAIVICSLLQTLVKTEMNLAEKFDFIQSSFQDMAGGGNIGFNHAIFLSERQTADRNYALGFYMKEHKCYPELSNLKDVLDFYFQCCSMEANCEIMSVIAATFANGGICPTTEQKVLQPSTVRDVLSIMHTCGTYDYSGQFAFKVGLPAKSGVCGGMMLSVPNVMGIFIWSPPLDALGNSVRATQFCEEFLKVFNFHNFDSLFVAHGKKDPRKQRFESKSNELVDLIFSAAAGDISTLRRYKLSGFDLTSSDYDGRTAIHLAASEGHLDCVRFLCEICEVNSTPKDRWGRTPIDDAEQFGYSIIVEYLKKFSKGGRNAVKDDPKFNIGTVNSSIYIITVPKPMCKISDQKSSGSISNNSLRSNVLEDTDIFRDLMNTNSEESSKDDNNSKD